MLINVGDIPVYFRWIDDATEQEAAAYVDYVKERVDGKIKSITITPTDDGMIDLDYQIQTTPFERIRRITGRDAGQVV